jgi:hypothetical protein
MLPASMRTLSCLFGHVLPSALEQAFIMLSLRLLVVSGVRCFPSVFLVLFRLFLAVALD